MQWLAIATLALAALEAVLLAGIPRWALRTIERERIRSAEREATLVNQVCHLVGRPWLLPQPEGVTILHPQSDPDFALDLVGDVGQLPDEE